MYFQEGIPTYEGKTEKQTNKKNLTIKFVSRNYIDLTF